MTYNLPSDIARCDGDIPNDAETELCQRREKCQRYIAHRSDDGGRMVAWMIPVRNCNNFIGAK